MGPRYLFASAFAALVSSTAALRTLQRPQLELVENPENRALHLRERCFQQHPYGIISAVDSRKQLPVLLNALGLFGYGVEIGVFQGVYSKHVLSQWKGRKLFLVDPWESQDAVQYDDVANMPQAKMDRNLNAVGARGVIDALLAALPGARVVVGSVCAPWGCGTHCVTLGAMTHPLLLVLCFCRRLRTCAPSRAATRCCARTATRRPRCSPTTRWTSCTSTVRHASFYRAKLTMAAEYITRAM